MGSFIDTQPSSQLNMTDTCNPPLSSVDIVDTPMTIQGTCIM